MVSFFQLSFFSIQKNNPLLISFKPVNKVLNVIRRLLANYAYQEGAVTPIQDMIDHAEQSKENSSGSYLSYSSLGLLVHDVWPGSIQKVKRGPRKQQQNVYLNLSRNDPAPAPKQHQCWIPLSHELAGISIPSDWKMMTDKSNFVSFVRPEKWEFNNVRAVTEVVVSKPANSANAFITIKAHGCQKDLSDVPGLSSLSVQGQVSLALEYIQKSSFCNGFALPEGESIQAFVPHVSGLYNDLSNDGQDNISLVFSSQCKIFAVAGARCSECNKVFKMQNKKRQRKEKRIGINPKCNKRYLAKEEVVLQLKKERSNRINAERREKYWRDKFENECFRMDDEDNADLSTMLQNAAKEKVPDEMVCLWEQQKKIMQTKTKHGYRWHPK